MVGGVDNWGAVDGVNQRGSWDHGLDNRSSWDDGLDQWSGWDDSVDQRSRGDHSLKDGSGRDHSLDQGSGRDHSLDQRSGMYHWGSMNNRGGVDHWHLAHQVHVALVGDGRGGAGVHVGSLGKNRRLDNRVGLGNQTGGSGGHSQASEEGDLWRRIMGYRTLSTQLPSPRQLTNLNIFGFFFFGGYAVIAESIATADDDRPNAGFL